MQQPLTSQQLLALGTEVTRFTTVKVQLKPLSGRCATRKPEPVTPQKLLLALGTRFTRFTTTKKSTNTDAEGGSVGASRRESAVARARHPHTHADVC